MGNNIINMYTFFWLQYCLNCFFFFYYNYIDSENLMAYEEEQQKLTQQQQPSFSSSSSNEIDLLEQSKKKIYEEMDKHDLLDPSQKAFVEMELKLRMRKKENGKWKKIEKKGGW